MILKSLKNSMVTGHDIYHYLGLRSTDDCYGVYVGFQEINEQLAPTKVGRSKNAQAIQRGRAQGGANWWFVAYYQLPTNADTHLVEREWKQQMQSQRIKLTTQRQTELYYLSPDDAVDELEALLISMGYEVQDLVDEILEDQLHEQLD
jgi:hypothetical protein